MRYRDFVRQRDSMQCGVACLAMVCRLFGARYSQEFVGTFCHATAQGVSLKGISDGAHALGLDTMTAKLTVTQLAACPLPAILHWDQRHFVVLHGVSRHGRRFHIADPGKGLIKLRREELAAHWVSSGSGDGGKGVAMFFEPTGGVRGDDTAGGRRSLRFLLGYLVQYRGHFLQIVLGLLLGCVLQLMMPFLTQWTVDLGIRHSDIRLVWLILLGELMIVAGRTATDFIRRWLLLHVSMRVNISLLSDFIMKLLRLPMPFFDTRLTGDLMQRMADHSRVQSFLTGQSLSLAFTAMSLVVFGAVLLVYDRLVFLIFLSGGVAYGAWTASFLRRREVLDHELFGRQAAAQNLTWQLVTTMQETKLQDCGGRRRWEWEDAQADLFAVQMRSLRLRQTQEAGAVFINELRNILVTVVAATAVINGHMTLGAMLAVQYIVGQLNSPVEQLMGFAYSLQDVGISLERINEVHGRGDEEEACGGVTGLSGERSIVLSGVSFRYDPHATSDTLSGISLEIPEGKVTAIVGASGSGKTTLIKLMLGYYPVRSGSISVAGRPIGEYSPGWWRRQCGVVMQDGVIFSESIARNIAVGDGEVDEGRLEMAARMASIHEHVMSLPLRYDTKVGRDGMGLSQGQRQRILIARAVYRDPAFIFLDEATNSLDATNERTITENLREFYRGRTVVVVAHRLSTVRDADRIVVLDRGRVVETGDHETLIGRKGAYYNLVRNQLDLGE